MNLLVPLLAGSLTGLGLHLTVRALRPGPLAWALERLHTGERPLSSRDRVVGWAGQLGAGRRRRDLAVTGRTVTAHAATRLSVALTLVGAVAVLGVMGGRVGWSLGLRPLGLLALAGLVGGFVLPDWSLQRAARRRRRAVAHALSAFLDLVNVLLAGGAGLETALYAAAEAGDGWVFEHLRATLLRARTTRRSVWTCLRELGDELGVPELAELSASVQLAGEQGARVAASLAARATATRAHLLARIEADAQAASERMGLPTVLMFVGFLFLLGYPAVQIILGSS